MGKELAIRNGRLITLEGIEGSGKGSQLKLIIKYLSEKGIPVSDMTFYEPGGTRLGDTLRVLLKRKADTSYAKDYLSNLVPLTEKFSDNPIVQSLLFLAARSDQLEKKVARELNDGKWVVLDRSRDSTTVYQGYGSPLKSRWLFDLPSAIKSKQDFSVYNSTVLGSIIHSVVSKKLVNEVSESYLREFLSEIKKFEISDFTKTLLYLAIQEEQCGDTAHLVASYLSPCKVQDIIPWTREANDMVFENAGVKIDKTIYLDVTAEEGLRRAKERERTDNPTGSKKDYFERKGPDHFEILRKGYLSEVKYYESLPEKDPQHKRIITISAQGKINDVADDIRRNVLDELIEDYLHN